VLAVDEQPAIQALERAQGYLKLPNGRALTGQAHDYKRRGNSTLFTALNVATGAIKAQHTKRRRRLEFLAFMNQVVADYPDQEIHVILDNLNTHKPKRDAWLARHKNVHFTSPRPTPAGSIRSRSGSRSSPAAPSTAPASVRSRSCAPPSTPLSKPTTPPPHPFNGATLRSAPRVSLHGSLIYDS
jgi:DDE superfamily endonuclease